MDDKTIDQRFVGAWGEIKNPPLDGMNPHFGNRYATLMSTLGVIREACKPHGIAYVQKLVGTESGREFHSFLLSGDGDELTLSVLPVEQPINPQAFGSNLTYTKRQQAQADWGITGEEDDDGNSAADEAKNRSGRGQAPSNRKPAPQRDEVPPSGHAQPPHPGRFAKIGELKKLALRLGVKESGIKKWLDAKFDGKPMKEFTDSEIAETEEYLTGLVADKQALNEAKRADEGQGGEE